MANEKDLTKGFLPRQILLFSLPLMLTNLLQVLFNMADIAVVGRFAGTEALGSVGSTTILVTLFTGLFIGLGGGVNVTAANYIGARRNDDVKETVNTGFLISLIFGFIIFIAAL